jgi:hypothetical protein
MILLYLRYYQNTNETAEWIVGVLITEVSLDLIENVRVSGNVIHIPSPFGVHPNFGNLMVGMIKGKAEAANDDIRVQYSRRKRS